MTTNDPIHERRLQPFLSCFTVHAALVVVLMLLRRCGVPISEWFVLSTGMVGVVPMLIMMGLAVPMVFLMRREAAIRRMATGFCPCGYSLKGLSSVGPCPECGRSSDRTTECEGAEE